MSRALSDAYRQAARENHTLLADVGRRFYELADTQDLYAADGIHPEAGSRLAAQVIATAIQTHKENGRSSLQVLQVSWKCLVSRFM